jgi:hypothetical protein
VEERVVRPAKKKKKEEKNTEGGWWFWVVRSVVFMAEEFQTRRRFSVFSFRVIFFDGNRKITLCFMKSFHLRRKNNENIFQWNNEMLNLHFKIC